MRPVLLLLALVVAGCGAGDQTLLFVDTDAIVPAAPGAPTDPARPAALFDRVRVELVRGGQVVAGTRADFAVHEGLFRERRVSVGVAANVEADLRVSLFLGDHLVDDAPPPLAVLRKTVRLPAASGKTRAHVVLRTDEVGVDPGAASPIAPNDGEPAESLVGSWPRAARVPCDRAAQPGEACVAGGAFWFGDHHPLEVTDEVRFERLVVVSPFFIDLHEATVADFRPIDPKLGSGPIPIPRDPTQSPTSPSTWCQYTLAPGTQDAMPINCVAHRTATSYCKYFDKDLPTEAQWEFVSSGRGAETDYPWGRDVPECDDTVLARGPLLPESPDFGANECVSALRPAGPRPPGSARRDRVTLEGAAGTAVEVVDLAGNIAEWMRDPFIALDDPFWSSPGVLVDPLSTAERDADTFRGGNWRVLPLQARATRREEVPRGAAAPGVGFRCVSPGQR